MGARNIQADRTRDRFKAELSDIVSSRAEFGSTTLQRMSASWRPLAGDPGEKWRAAAVVLDCHRLRFDALASRDRRPDSHHPARPRAESTFPASSRTLTSQSA
jgi:hypothetical protein